MIKLSKVDVKVGDLIITSELIEEVEGSKTYNSKEWIVQEIRVTMSTTNFILKEVKE